MSLGLIAFNKVNTLLRGGGAGCVAMQNVAVFPEQFLEIVEADDGVGAIVLESTVNLVAGNEYTVMFDDVKYRATAYLVEGAEFSTVQLGNDALAGGENNTEEPFLFVKLEVGDILLTNSTGIHKVAIYGQTEVIHPIDPKFLPKGIGGVTSFDLTTIGYSWDNGVEDDVPLTYEVSAETAEQLRNAIDSMNVAFTPGDGMWLKATSYQLREGDGEKTYAASCMMNPTTALIVQITTLKNEVTVMTTTS